MLPGLTRVSEIGTPSASSSIRSESVKPLTACLDAEYMPSSGATASDTSLPMLISAPPCFLRCGRATSEPFTTPQKFVCIRR